jgi:hypothetical protein
MRLGKFKAKKDSRFVKDSYLVQIDWEKSTPHKIIIKKVPHSDIIDSVLYAFKESWAFTHQPAPPAKPKWGTPKWAQEEADAMFEHELEKMQEEQDFNSWIRKGEY